MLHLSVRCVQLFATRVTVAHQAPLQGTLQARLQEIPWPRNRTLCLLYQQMVLYHCDAWEAPRIYTRYIHTRNKFKALETWTEFLRMWIKASRVSPEILSFQPNGNFQAVVKGGGAKQSPAVTLSEKTEIRAGRWVKGIEFRAKHQRELQRERTLETCRGRLIVLRLTL